MRKHLAYLTSAGPDGIGREKELHIKEPLYYQKNATSGAIDVTRSNEPRDLPESESLRVHVIRLSTAITGKEG